MEASKKSGGTCDSAANFGMASRTVIASLSIALAALTLTACGSSLSASSTCQDFLNASPQDQQSAVDKLAAQYDEPDYATPLGEPEVPYYCSSNPSVTLGYFFSHAQG